MGQRYQTGSVFERNGKRVVQWWEDGHRRKLTLGPVGRITKAEAQKQLAAIVGPLNSRDVPPSKSWKFADFVERVYLLFYRRKWKRSTAATNEDRLRNHLTLEFGSETLGAFNRDMLQAFIDKKA